MVAGSANMWDVMLCSLVDRYQCFRGIYVPVCQLCITSKKIVMLF